jgi:hypothetical protein
MTKLLTAVAAAGLGAAAGYYLDPVQGRRRRALARDQFVHLRHLGRDAAATTSRDLENRALGFLAIARRTLRPSPISDEVLSERVRAQLGYAVTHPSSVEVSVRDGRVRLSGPILAADLTRLLRRVSAVRGVASVDNQLAIHDDPTGIPGLQGEPSPRFHAWEFAWMQRNWSPAARLGAAVVGGALVLVALTRSQVIGVALGLPGLALLTRALINRELTRLAGALRSRAA